MSLLQWLFIIWAPLAIAAASSITTWLFVRSHYERRLDAAYEDGWRAGRQWYPPGAVQPPLWTPAPPSVHHERPPGGAVRASEPLRALPAGEDAGGRHAGPTDAPLRLSDLEALARVRAEFARIRQGLGLHV